MPLQTAARDRLDAVGIDAICADIADGKSLSDIARDAGVAFGSLQTWVAATPERAVRVREARIHTARLWDELAESSIKSADGPFELARARELAHHYRWRAGKISPRDYGQQVEITGAEGGPLQITRIERVIVDAQPDAADS